MEGQQRTGRGPMQGLRTKQWRKGRKSRGVASPTTPSCSSLSAHSNQPSFISSSITSSNISCSRKRSSRGGSNCSNNRDWNSLDSSSSMQLNCPRGVTAAAAQPSQGLLLQQQCRLQLQHFLMALLSVACAGPCLTGQALQPQLWEQEGLLQAPLLRAALQGLLMLLLGPTEQRMLQKGRAGGWGSQVCLQQGSSGSCQGLQGAEGLLHNNPLQLQGALLLH